MNISDLSESDMKQLFGLFQKSVSSLKERNIEDSKIAQMSDKFWDFEGKEGSVAVSERDEDGLLSFSEMKIDKTRTTSFRQSILWRKSCEKWMNHFKDMEQPVLIWWSNKGTPLKNTCYLREVKSEKTEVTKIGSVKESGIAERTLSYQNTYGVEIPPEDFRLRSKDRMHSIFGIRKADSAGFIRWQQQVSPQTTEAQAAVEIAPRNPIGIVYEQQLEYHYNMAGYHVNLHGIKQTRNDEGVDHILIKNGKTSLVQAKAYRNNSSLSVSDLDMIYGNLNDFYTKHVNNLSLVIGNLERVILTVPSSETLSRECKSHAERIGLAVEVVPIREDWPKYKCITSSKKKVFYAPGTGNYSAVEMLSKKDRFWADSLEEAYGKNYKQSGHKE